MWKSFLNFVAVTRRISGALRLFLSISVLLTSFLGRASDAVDRFVSARAVDSASMAVVVIDLDEGSIVESYNADVPLIPASVMKSVTIGTLIGHTGIDYRYHTRLFAAGTINKGVLNGNLIIEGGGDPSLNSDVEPITPDFVRECLRAVQDAGIERITGRIIADDDIFPGPAVPASWMKADLPHAYGTGCHGLNFENNSSGSRSVANPGAVLQSRLKNELIRSGIAVEGASIRSGEEYLLFDHQSASIDEIMRSCMMRSDNLFAEALLRTYGLECANDGTTATSAQLERDYWASQGFPMEGVNIVDGSGLSRDNRLTAAFLAEVLRYMSPNVDYVSFFPLAGQEGTLRRFLADTPLEGYIAMKTGSMSGIQCYAGYKLDDNYTPTHVVVIMMNNIRTRAGVKGAASRLLLDIFAETRPKKHKR